MMANETTTAIPELTPEQEKLAQDTMNVAGNMFAGLFNQTADTVNTVGTRLESTADTLAKPLQVAATSLTPFTVAVPGLTQTWSKFAMPQNPLDTLTSIASEVGNKWAATGLRLTTQDDNKAVQFATKLGATEEELKTLNEALDESALGMGKDTTGVSKAMMGIIATKTPDNLIDAFEDADPSMKTLLDGIRGDEDMKKALHNAASKDSTVLEGLQKMAGKESAIGSDALAKAIKDPEVRDRVIKYLNLTAENENLKFGQFAEFADAAVDFNSDRGDKQKGKRLQKAMLAFGDKNAQLDMLVKFGTPAEMLGQMWEDPHAFFDQMAEALGGGPAQVAALKQLGGLMANFIGMYSEDPGFNALMKSSGQGLGDFASAISGQTDKRGGTYNTGEVKPTLATVYPDAGESQTVVRATNNGADAEAATTPAPAATPEHGYGANPSAINPDVVIFNHHLEASVSKGAEPKGPIPVSLNGPSVLTGIYSPKALGIIPPEDSAKFGEGLANTLANRKREELGFGMAS